MTYTHKWTSSANFLYSHAAAERNLTPQEDATQAETYRPFLRCQIENFEYYLANFFQMCFFCVKFQNWFRIHICFRLEVSACVAHSWGVKFLFAAAWLYKKFADDVHLLWQYRLWSFQGRDTKLERLWAKNNCSHMKFPNFDNWSNGELSKIGHQFRKKVI